MPSPATDCRYLPAMSVLGSHGAAAASLVRTRASSHDLAAGAPALRDRCPRPRRVVLADATRASTGGSTRGLAGREGAGAAATISAMFTSVWPQANKLEDLFDAWVFAAHEARLAWDAWASAAPRVRADAYTAFRTSLDHEERAAAALAAAVTASRGSRIRPEEQRLAA
jgi:hypothetical protein